MAKRREIRNSTAEFLICQIEGKEQGIEVYYKDKTVWCTQKAMGMLFDCSSDNVGLHLKNIFASGELVKDSVTEKISATASDGKNYMTQFYNLDAIISVGYRVNSIRATQFRQWATSVLREYAIRGYVLDRKRMENGTFLDEDYFEHLLAEIREIRLSERRFYQKLTDIYATAIDYNRDAPTTRLFFKMMQNKTMVSTNRLHYAVHGRTAAELIVERADAEQEHMGLTTWENAPDGKIVKTDVSIAKNYLKEMNWQISLTFGRRYFRSKLKLNANLFGSLLAYSYLCSVRMKVLATPLSAGSKTLSPLLHFKSHLIRAAFIYFSYSFLNMRLNSGFAANPRFTIIDLLPLNINTSIASWLDSKYALMSEASKRALYSVAIFSKTRFVCPIESNNCVPTEPFPCTVFKS